MSWKNKKNSRSTFGVVWSVMAIRPRK